MINTKFNSYCQDCSELDVIDKTIESNDPINGYMCVVHTLTCKHMQRCEDIAESIRRELKKK